MGVGVRVGVGVERDVQCRAGTITGAETGSDIDWRRD